MEAKELRIGNWVNLYDDFNSQVTGLTNTKKVWCVDNPTNEECAWSTNRIKPIPLTEEWLLKLGLVESNKIRNRFIEENQDFEIEIQGLNYAYCLWGGEDAPHLTQFLGHCKHVHQLQNLYFALTGNELTI